MLSRLVRPAEVVAGRRRVEVQRACRARRSVASSCARRCRRGWRRTRRALSRAGRAASANGSPASPPPSPAGERRCSARRSGRRSARSVRAPSGAIGDDVEVDRNGRLERLAGPRPWPRRACPRGPGLSSGWGTVRMSALVPQSAGGDAGADPRGLRPPRARPRGGRAARAPRLDQARLGPEGLARRVDLARRSPRPCGRRRIRAAGAQGGAHHLQPGLREPGLVAVVEGRDDLVAEQPVELGGVAPVLRAVVVVDLAADRPAVACRRRPRATSRRAPRAGGRR